MGAVCQEEERDWSSAAYEALFYEQRLHKYETKRKALWNTIFEEGSVLLQSIEAVPGI